MVRYVRSVAGIVLVVVIVLAALRLAPTNGPPSSAAAPPTPGPGTPIPIVSPRPYEPPPTLPLSAPVTPKVPPVATPTPRATPVRSFMPIAPSPTVIPSNFPTPSALPTDLPHPAVFSEGDLNTVALDTKLAAVVAKVRVREIDPPVFRNSTNTLPQKLTEQSDFIPAVLDVLEVYKGPAMTQIGASTWGGCFSPTACVEAQNYRWSDLIGYDLIAFFNPPIPTDTLDHNYHAFRIYVIDPKGGRVLDATRLSGPPYRSLSTLIGEIESAAK